MQFLIPRGNSNTISHLPLTQAVSPRKGLPALTGGFHLHKVLRLPSRAPPFISHHFPPEAPQISGMRVQTSLRTEVSS